MELPSYQSQVHGCWDNSSMPRKWMLHSGGDRGSHFIGVTMADQLIEDLGPSMSLWVLVRLGRQVDPKRISACSSCAIASREFGRSRQIRQFVQAGGILSRTTCATNERHGRDSGAVREHLRRQAREGQVKDLRSPAIENYAALRLQVNYSISDRR